MHAHQGGLVIAVEDVDEICNGQHTCEKGMALHLGKYSDVNEMWWHKYTFLPTNVCNLLSHKSAALRPFATSAKKAFFTFGSMTITQFEDL